MIYDDNFLGFYVIGLNCVFIIQSYYYICWFMDDNLESRDAVRFGFHIVLIYQVLLFTALFCIILFIPF